MTSRNLDQICINTIRFLAVDTVQKANSGHPGTPMGAAAMAYVLWDRFLKHNPGDPTWPDRDRFILSPGHASALLYSLLHLTGYDLPLEEMKQFRQWGSKTPGHPEYGLTPGVEMTTGPLGQGFAHGIGMAVAERWLANHYNHSGHEIINHRTYAIVSDGDLQEGVASEAASLAGTLRLGKVIYLYDDNDISIEGNTDIAFAENVAQRFQAYGWHVIGPVDGIDPEVVDSAIRMAQAETARPSLIICRTVIGYGSPNKAGTASAHGEPLGEEEIRLTKEQLGWPYQEPFTLPEEAQSHFRQAQDRGRSYQEEWQARMEDYRREYPVEAAMLEEALKGHLPDGWDQDLDGLFNDADKPMATREASGRVMNAIAERVHSFTGGSADLAPSTKTLLKDHGHYGFEEYCGHNMHFGVREHAMGSIANGMALHGGTIPYTATFLIFSDYMRPPIRLAALMDLRVVYIFTHDSIGLGEDGPRNTTTFGMARRLNSCSIGWCVPAIRSLIGRGININVTLIFSRVAYQQVAEAYISGLEDLTQSGGDVSRVASVASFFVSRLDSVIDALLEESIRSGETNLEELLGKAAIANAKLAYRDFKAIFSNATFTALKEKGARPQRPLWASTGTKNPAYSDVLYLDSLIASDTVNTVPPATLTAFVDHGRAANTLEQGGDEAQRTIQALASAGIKLDQVTDQLLADGLKGFVESFEKLMVNIEDKKARLLAREHEHPGVSLGAYLPDVESALADLQRRQVISRIWTGDHTVWKPDPTEITNRLGWLTVTDVMCEQLPLMEAFANEVREAGFRHVVLLGMGGSSLGPEVLRQALGSAPGYPELIVLDSTVPAWVRSVAEAIDPAHTIFLVSSKSGSTTEPNMFYAYFRDLVEKAVGKDRAGQHFIAVTDPGTSLEKMARKQGFRQVFSNPPEIGGRYSVLSYFGLVPYSPFGSNK